MKTKKSRKGLLSDSRGFSLIEVLLGVAVFMIGMLGVTALNISSMKSSAFSGNLSEATLLAAAKIEELMTEDFDTSAFLGDTDGDGTGQDTVNDDGIDDDAAVPGTHDDDDNFGLDDCPECNGDPADHSETSLGNNDMYTVYWNVAENEPISVSPTRTKRIKVIVVWSIKGEPRQVSMSAVRMKEENL